ncbi:hypothetical protein [Coxiella burnetii]|uniref:Uncharacterized protein n=2 Tax=Coxiella burnetii TaxID=777 RepID=B5QSD1_COXBU|nr:hypothetical protein [Coxiella burnetii]YP_002333004.1 hypothetical protein CBU_1422a [Coxiella burnetii RSA 493]ABS76617.1 hypothetical protein CBUD_0574 [Coxiella burnetii Dugway 5J108-111]ABX78804.1 hypothetical protein COXBURSA331_A1583 [Coxiella burnetii RSA 331]ACI15295.1 hypothetical protein CBU_1422a [Coxiella burnetii RSA 493]ACJ18005.1 hypothetical protein CbuG_0594 [Coxiella burnetii CbuG_Q212]AIT63730.1 hypothetical protein CBNA_1492 [Coxiella burnetii str. Namibia]
MNKPATILSCQLKTVNKDSLILRARLLKTNRGEFFPFCLVFSISLNF